MTVDITSIKRNKNYFKANSQLTALRTRSFVAAGKIVCSQRADGKLERDYV